MVHIYVELKSKDNRINLPYNLRALSFEFFYCRGVYYKLAFIIEEPLQTFFICQKILSFQSGIGCTDISDTFKEGVKL